VVVLQLIGRNKIVTGHLRLQTVGHDVLSELVLREIFC